MRASPMVKIISSLIAIAVIGVVIVIYPKSGDEKIVSMASDGNLNGLKKNLSEGGNLNARAFDDRKTPLIAASLNGHLDTVKFLVESGADINLRDGGGTSLYWAAFCGRTEIFQYLLTHGAKLDADKESRSYLIRTMQDKGWTSLIEAVKAESQLEEGAEK